MGGISTKVVRCSAASRVPGISGLVLIATLTAFAACSDSSDLTEDIRSYEEAFNRHSIEDVVILFTADPTYEIEGQFTVRGRNALRDVLGYDIALDGRISIGSMKVRGDTVFAHLTDANNWLAAAGIQEAHYRVAFVFQDGAIAGITASPTPETARALGDVMVPLLEWAHREAPDRLNELMPNGRFDFTAENAERMLALLEDWRGASEPQE